MDSLNFWEKQEIEQDKRLAIESVAANRKMLKTMQSDRRRAFNQRPMQQENVRLKMIKIVRDIDKPKSPEREVRAKPQQSTIPPQQKERTAEETLTKVLR